MVAERCKDSFAVATRCELRVVKVLFYNPQ